MARSFDGSSGRLTYTAGASQKDLTTISIHYKAYRIGAGELGYGVIGSHATGASRRFHIENDNGGAGWGIVFKAYHSTTEGTWSIAYPTDNIWYDYVLTYDHGSTSNDPIWYKDGASQAVTERVTPVGTATSNDDSIYIGNRSDDGQTWNGYIAEYAVWNRVLTAAEAATLGAGYSPLFIPNGLVFYVPLLGNNSAEPDLRYGTTASITSTSKVAHPRIIYPRGFQSIDNTAAAGGGTSVKDLILSGFIPFSR